MKTVSIIYVKAGKIVLHSMKNMLELISIRSKSFMALLYFIEKPVTDIQKRKSDARSY